MNDAPLSLNIARKSSCLVNTKSSILRHNRDAFSSSSLPAKDT